MLSILSERFSAFIMALTLFFLGLPYGNEPIKVDYTVKIVKEEQAIVVKAEVTNVGRPYIGSTHDDPSVFVYRIVDGEKVYMTNYASACTADMPRKIIVKHGDVRNMQTAYFHIICDPGEYIVEVRIEHSDKIYTETVMLP